MKYKIGDEVTWEGTVTSFEKDVFGDYWRPKGAKSPTFGRVTGINRGWTYPSRRRKESGDDIYIIQTERKGEVEAFEHELSLLEDA